MAVFNIIQDRFWKAEFRDSVAEDASDLVFTLKNSHIIAISCKNNGNGQSGRAGADNCGFYAIGRSRALRHLVGISSGNIIFNGGKVDWSAFAAQDTVAFALIFMVAYQTAYGSQGIIFKKETPGFIQLIFF